jgi:hypothetical protein
MVSGKKYLDSFERAKILEIYFLRIEGRTNDSIPRGHEVLYSMDLNEMKTYLLGQETKDSILPQVLNVTESA